MQTEEINCDIYRLDFAKYDWREISPSQRCKFFRRDNLLINLREFTKNNDTDDDGWCESKHIGYVVKGKAEIDFGIKKIIFRSGDGIFIPAGRKHKLQLLSKKLLIFYVDELSSSSTRFAQR